MAIADRAVSKKNVNLAKNALREQPRITITQFARDNGMARATASAAINRARQEMARIETKAEIKSELQEKQHKKVNPLKGRVSQHKINIAVQALTENPSITGKELKDILKCKIDAANLALRAAKFEIEKSSQNIRERAERLVQERAEKALDSAERQIRDRLDTLRANADALQDKADSTGETEDIQAANFAWKQLTDYERKVTGIELGEKAATAAAGKTDITLQLPISPADILLK